MTVGRVAAIVFIFLCVTVAWVILGSSVTFRTNQGHSDLGRQVEQLWGSEQMQLAPQVTVALPDGSKQSLELASSQIHVDLSLDQRRKGLMWYDTYNVALSGRYSVQNTLQVPITATVVFTFPSDNAIYDDFELRIGEQQITPRGVTSSVPGTVQLEPGESAEVYVAYKSRGLDRWVYRFADRITTVRDFSLTVNTDFAEYDFPERTVSASSKTRTAQGWELQWRFGSLVSDFGVGVEMPHKLNPGPLASRMSFFAPVSLLFFFTVLLVLGVVKGVNLHPMHYFYLGAAFFAFHLLFAYLVDHVLVEAAFVIAALVSLGLVISYLWRVVGPRFALREAGLAQLIFLVLFSYAFFFEGYTGLVVTVGAILTLAVLMQVTAKVDWAAKFAKKPKA
jgi:hypothetical protein